MRKRIVIILATLIVILGYGSTQANVLPVEPIKVNKHLTVERMKELKKRVKVTMACTAILIIDEDTQGNQDIEDIEEVIDVDEFEVINEI